MKTLDWQTLRNDGYLQEVNRQFFHPLGLALAITIDGDKGVLSILDGRDDPEGFNFIAGIDLNEMANRLKAIADARLEARVNSLGYWHQPTSDAAGGS